MVEGHGWRDRILTGRGSRCEDFGIRWFSCSNQYAFGYETATQTKATKLGKPPLKNGIAGGVGAILSGLFVNLMFYWTWVRITLTDLGSAAVALISGAQLESGSVNLSVPRYSLPADLLGYLHIPPYTFLLIRMVGALGMILGFLGIATARAGLRIPARIIGVFALISFALLTYEISFLLQAFSAGAMSSGAGVSLAFSEDLGLGCGSMVGGIGLLISGAKMARA
jgi:hypothetical protein